VTGGGPTRGEISGVADPLGWRLILGVLIAQVPVPTLAGAVEVAAAAVAAGDVDGHLTADLHPDRVVLRLHTVATGAVTDHDLRLAEAISAVVRTEPGDPPPQNVEIAIDVLDVAAVRPFWQAVTGYVDEPGPSDLPPGALVDPLRRGPSIWFQQMDAARHEHRNRIHVDVDVPPEHARARIDAAVAAGGRLTYGGAAPAWWVLADPEGNEVCVCTWQGRD
jgi:4a-hydroxytetrahydrobiopterin dehydratase